MDEGIGFVDWKQKATAVQGGFAAVLHGMRSTAGDALPSGPTAFQIGLADPRICRAKYLEVDGTYSSSVDFDTPAALCAGDGGDSRAMREL